MYAPQGYLLCRPVGGLNDSLNQFEICCRYAAATGRAVLLDGQYSGFLDSWDKYFLLRENLEPAVHFYHPGLNADLNKMTCRPLCLAGKIGAYTATGSPDNCVDTLTGTPLRFDLSLHHPETLLVHHQYGGGTLSFSAVSKLKLVPEITSRIARLKEAHPDYVALHVRNTDYQTAYEPLLEAIQATDAKKILLCSDDARCKDRARTLLGDRLFFATDTPDTGGKSLHANAQLDRWRENCNALADLAMLALANKLYIAPTTTGPYSGFSLLANFLHHNRQALEEFLGAPSSNQSAPP
jgi:hypothetical protein